MAGVSGAMAKAFKSCIAVIHQIGERRARRATLFQTVSGKVKWCIGARMAQNLYPKFDYFAQDEQGLPFGVVQSNRISRTQTGGGSLA